MGEPLKVQEDTHKLLSSHTQLHDCKSLWQGHSDKSQDTRNCPHFLLLFPDLAVKSTLKPCLTQPLPHMCTTLTLRQSTTEEVDNISCINSQIWHWNLLSKFHIDQPLPEIWERVDGRMLSIHEFLNIVTITRDRILATFPASIHKFGSGNLLPNLHINQPLPEMWGVYTGACCRSRHMLLHYDNLEYTGNCHI